MRPPDFNKASQIKMLSPIVLIGLFLGVLITTLLWLEVPAQVISPLFLLILAAAGLSAFFILRQPSSRTRWLRLLAVTAAVSLVYLFPEMFSPVCGDTPRAFASPSTRCGRCVDFVCEWNYKKHKEWCYCNEWDTSGCTDTNPPTIQAGLNCDQWGLDNWCVGSLFLDLIATEPQGREVLISGDVDGTVFACPSGTGSATCSIPLPEGAGIVSYTATSANGLTASGSNPYQRDSIQPQINGALSGTSGKDSWYISPVDVSASAADPAPGSGMAVFEYSLNSGNWETFIDPLNLVDGVHSLNLRATDVAGNFVETNQTIQVDTVTPALALSLNGTAGTNGWYISMVEVNATAGDDGSGLAVLEASVGGGPWSEFTAPLLFDNGRHSYQFRAIDHAGNLTETPLQWVSVDTIPPAIDLPSSWVLGQTVGFKLQDDGSGLAGFRVVIEDEDERFPKVTWDEGLSGNKFKDEIAWNGRFKDGSLAPPEGEYYAWLKVSDNAGNESMRAGQIFVEAVASSPVYLPSVPVHAPETPESVESGNAVPQTFFSPTVSVPPVASFGGGSNSVQSSPTQAGKVSFNSSASSSPPIANPQSGILWGASATAAIGAFAAEYVHRKEIEKAAMRARVAARQERRAASNAHQKIKAKKLKQLEAKWRQIEQAAQARKQAALDRRIDRNDVAVEIEMRSHLTRAKAQKDAAARARQKAYDVYRVQEVAAHTKIRSQEMEKSWWEKAIDWVDNHQKEASIGIGVAAGLITTGLVLAAATTAVVTLPVILAAIGAAAVASGVSVAIGTGLLNNYYERDLVTNLWSNIGAAVASAAITTGLGIFIFGGGLTSALITMGNGAAALCANNQTLCSFVEPIIKGVDFLEETGLMLKGAIQTWRGDILGAAETAHELQMEYMDGGMPGNAIAKELGEEVSEWVTKYGADVVDFVSLYGDDAVDLIRKYGGDGVTLLHLYGDGVVNLVETYGDIAVNLLTKYGDDGVEILERYGDNIFSVGENGILVIAGENAEVIAKELSEITNNEVFYSVGKGMLSLPKSTDEGVQASYQLVKVGVGGTGSEELIQVIVENSTRGNGNRLVLGKWVKMEDGGGYVKDALDNGGIFLDTGPEVSKLLEDNGIEFWVVNEKFLESQLESGVERIDFVSGNVDDLLEMYYGVPDTDVPYSVREIRWLENNAEEYVRVGNSWIKKP